MCAFYWKIDAELNQILKYYQLMDCAWVLIQQEMERLENQPCEWDDHMLAQALESEQRREQEGKRLQEEEELKKLQV